MQQLIEALEKNYSEDEKNYDLKVSARIADAAKTNQPLSLDEAYKDLETKSDSLQNLRFKEVKEFINDKKNCAGQGLPPSLNLLATIAAMPNNPIILHYLMQSLLELDSAPIRWMLYEALKLAVKNQCLSNVKVILEEFKRNYFFAASHEEIKHLNLPFDMLFTDNFFSSCLRGTCFDVYALGNNHLSLLTASPLIDIVLLFYKSGNFFLNKELLFVTDEHKKYDIKTNSILNRNLIALNIYRFSSSSDHVNHLDSDRMVSLLSEFSGPEEMVLQLYGKFFDFLLKADVEKLKSLKYLSAFIQRCCHSKILRLQMGDELKESEYLGNLVALDDALALEQKYAETPDYLKKALGFYPAMLDRVSVIIVKELALPSVLISLILQYFESTIFEKIQAIIEVCFADKDLYFKQKSSKICFYPVIRERTTDQKFSGIWGLFNICNFLSKLSIYPSQLVYEIYNRRKVSGHEKLAQYRQFDQFRQELVQYSGKQAGHLDDLTAQELTLIFEQIARGEAPKIEERFPGLQKNLQDMQEAGGMPAYTILDFPKVAGDQKDIYSTVCKKMQTAVNFYKLSMRKKNREKTLHCFLIRTSEYWLVEFLALSYSKKNTFYLIQMDSSHSSAALLHYSQFWSDLLSKLRNATGYAQQVAEKVIPVMNKEMTGLRQVQLTSGLNSIQNQTAYNYCALIADFFSTFGSLDFVKLYLPVLSLAISLTQFLPLRKGLVALRDVHEKSESLPCLLWMSAQQTQLPGTSHLSTSIGL